MIQASHSRRELLKFVKYAKCSHHEKKLARKKKLHFYLYSNTNIFFLRFKNTFLSFKKQDCKY